MFLKHTLGLLNKYISPRSFHTTVVKSTEREHPFFRTLRILKEDFTRAGADKKNEIERQRALMGLFPRHADIVIIGGGPVGSSIAYWLKEKTSRDGIRVVVIEKDLTYSQCSTVLSHGGLRQQFSLPENIQMSIYTAEFIRTIKKRFGPRADVQFTPQGCLILADEEGAQQLIDNSRLQQELGAVNKILTKDQLKRLFPWMQVSDVELGCLGLEKEGWFNPKTLLSLIQETAMDMGAQYVQAEAVDFTFRPRHDIVMEGIEESYESLQELIIKMPDGEYRQIQFAYCVIAAGLKSVDLAQLARIGMGTGMLSVSLPIEKRKRFLYKFDCRESPPGINSPLTIDYSGVYFRRMGLGGSFIGGFSPLPQTTNEDLDDFKYFDEEVKHILANRVPAFKNIEVTNSRSGFYEYNCFDENGVVGPHPYYHNLYLATGFSGHGIQQAPAVGRAVAELILDGDFKTIDLTRLGFDRLIVDKPMYEICSY